MMNSSNATLLAIVSVAPANRIQCENPGGCHGVYAAIQQELLAAFEDQATERERALAVLQSMRSGAGLQRINTRPAPSFPSSQRRPQAADQHTSAPSPWLWQKAGTSVAVLRSPAVQHWVRVQHRDGTQKLVPWPVFDGWEHALPPCYRSA